MPELYQPADRRSLAKVWTVVVGIVLVGLATFLGASVGTQVIHGTHPTKADVRAAAHSLAPPGYTVTSERLNAYEGTGAWFATASYAVAIDVEGGGPLEDRVAAFHRQAMSEGWRVGEDAGVGPSFIRFDERAGILASVAVGGEGSVGDEGGVSNIQAFRLKEPSIGPFFAFAGIGALVGLAIALVVGFLVLRRQRPVGP